MTVKEFLKWFGIGAVAALIPITLYTVAMMMGLGIL